MNATDLAQRVNQLLVEIFELKQAIDAMTDAPAELVDRMARLGRTAKALQEAMPES